MSITPCTLIMASFVGDSLALGAHWIYDPGKIKERFGRISGLSAPAPGSYHSGKQAGDLTHYGDQTLVLLESVAAKRGFDLDDFAARWRALFADYAGYVDGATRRTLERFDFGAGPDNAGSNSRDLAGASRIAPLVAALRHDPAALLQAVRAQTAMTHATPDVLDAAAFFARAAVAAYNGAHPREAVETAAGESYAAGSIAKWVEKGLGSVERDTVEAIQSMGPTCHVDEALPGVVHCIAKYAQRPEEALAQCVMAGGDSAARAMLVGLVLLAWPENKGLESVPGSWVEGLRAGPRIRELCARLP